MAQYEHESISPVQVWSTPGLQPWMEHYYVGLSECEWSPVCYRALPWGRSYTAGCQEEQLAIKAMDIEPLSCCMLGKRLKTQSWWPTFSSKHQKKSGIGCTVCSSESSRNTVWIQAENTLEVCKFCFFFFFFFLAAIPRYITHRVKCWIPSIHPSIFYHLSGTGSRGQ